MNADEIKKGKRYRITERYESGATAIYEDVVHDVERGTAYFKNLPGGAYVTTEVTGSDLASVSIERIYEGLPTKVGTVVEDADGQRWFLIGLEKPTWYSEFGTTVNNGSFQTDARTAALAGRDWTVIVEGK